MTRRSWIWLAIAVVLGIGLWFVPLFGVLGFEHAVVVVAFAAPLGLDLGAARARVAQARMAIAARSAYPNRAMLRGTLTAGGTAIAIACVPGVLAAIHGIWVPTCDWWFGIEAYALMPIVTAAFGGALGFAIAVAVGMRSEPRRWLPHRSTVVALAVPIIVLAAAGGWRFYSEPPVFIYNPLIGYFPGNMYDEHIRLGAPLVWSRVEQLAWLVAIIAVVAARIDVPTFRLRWREPRPAARRSPAFAVAFVALAGAVVLHLQASSLGYAIGADDIQAELGGRLETAHFIIHYAKTPEVEKDIDVIARDHELRYAEIVAEIGVAPEGKLESYYFASTEQKGRWFGARNVEMAKPWRHEIYVDHRAFPHSSLRHEIAHAIASAFGDRWFGVATRYVLLFNPGLIEGLAVALDWPGNNYDRLTPHEAVRAMQVQGVEPSIEELLSINFFMVPPSRGYVTAGSFLHFLLERYGAEKLRELYHSGGDFDGAYGKSMGDLVLEWRAMIAKIELPKTVVESMRERFRGGSVFSRPCPHAIAARRDHAAELLGRGDRVGAIDLMRHVCNDAPEEPRHRIDLGDMLSLGSTTERDEARAMWTAIASDDHITPSLRGQAYRKLAALETDDVKRTALVDQAVKLPLDGDDRRQLDAIAYALHYTGPAGPSLRAYFFAEPAAGRAANTKPNELAVAAVTAEPELGFAHYLLGLQRINAGDFVAAAAELDTALAHELPGPAFVRFAARQLAIGAYRANDPARVKRAIAVMTGPDMFETDHLLAEDWAHRLAFDATGHL